ncbi:MAG: DUF6520 family protein [Ferruginibacter sp.]
MKHFKFRLFLAAIVIATGLSFAATAPRNSNPVTYHYTSNSTILTDMKNISNWQGVDAACGVSGDIPCAFTYDGNFSAHLQTYTSAAALVANADTRRQ